MVTAVEAEPRQPTPRGRVAYGLPFVVPLVISTLTHGTMFIGLLLKLLLGGGSPGQGEQGVGGAGDTTIDISVAGVSAPPAAPASSALAPMVPDETPPAPITTAPAPAPAPTAPQHKDEQATASNNSVQGTGAEANHTGRMARDGDDPLGVQGGSPDSVQGQRALLPSAARCTDPVAGRWEAIRYEPVWGIWVRFTLAVHRADNLINGTITSRTWFGGPQDRTPPSCDRNPEGDFTVRMVAHGVVSDQDITFGSSSYTIVETHCPGSAQYAPDNFSGRIDPARQEFQSVNNDGARDVNAPYVFRRTSCSE